MTYLSTFKGCPFSGKRQSIPLEWLLDCECELCDWEIQRRQEVELCENS